MQQIKESEKQIDLTMFDFLFNTLDGNKEGQEKGNAPRVCIFAGISQDTFFIECIYQEIYGLGITSYKTWKTRTPKMTTQSHGIRIEKNEDCLESLYQNTTGESYIPQNIDALCIVELAIKYIENPNTEEGLEAFDKITDALRKITQAEL